MNKNNNLNKNGGRKWNNKSKETNKIKKQEKSSRHHLTKKYRQDQKRWQLCFNLMEELHFMPVKQEHGFNFKI